MALWIVPAKKATLAQHANDSTLATPALAKVLVFAKILLTTGTSAIAIAGTPETNANTRTSVLTTRAKTTEHVALKMTRFIVTAKPTSTVNDVLSTNFAPRGNCVVMGLTAI